MRVSDGLRRLERALRAPSCLLSEFHGEEPERQILDHQKAFVNRDDFVA